MKYFISKIFKVLGLFFVVSTLNVDETIQVFVLLTVSLTFFLFEWLIDHSTKDGSIVFPEDSIKEETMYCKNSDDMC
jgi:hypothetical protein